jgi:hypothetical protein
VSSVQRSLPSSVSPPFPLSLVFPVTESHFLLAATVCVVIPVLAHSALIKQTQTAIVRDRILFIVSVVMMVVGTFSAFSQSTD